MKLRVFKKEKNRILKDKSIKDPAKEIELLLKSLECKSTDWKLTIKFMIGHKKFADFIDDLKGDIKTYNRNKVVIEEVNEAEIENE